MLKRLGTVFAAIALIMGLGVAVPEVSGASPPVPQQGESPNEPGGAEDPAAFIGSEMEDVCGDQCSEILPPGQNGNATLAQILAHQTLGTMPDHTDDQLGTYEALASGHTDLSTDTIDEFFNDASFGVESDQVDSEISPRDDVTITRDKEHDVPHIHGTTREGTQFGAGYAAAQDRLWLMDVLRHVGRGEVTPFAGGAEENRELEQQFFQEAPYTEEELQEQIDTALEGSGERGEQGLADAEAYVDGINAYIEEAHSGRYFPGEYVLTGHVDAITNEGEIEPFVLTDLVVLASVIGAQFGSGGGGEVQAAMAKLAIQEQYGPEEGERVWQSLRNEDDPETVRTLHDGQSFPYGKTPEDPRGVAMPDPDTVNAQEVVFDESGSAEPEDAEPRAEVDAPEEWEPARGVFNDGVLDEDMLSDESGMSNALVVSGEHTESGNPISVSGPQTGYFAPQLLMLQELQGPGINARGASFAGLSMYVLLGRGQDYAWSATSAGQDVTDTYAVDLCEPDGSSPTRDSDHYLFRDECVPMDVVERENAWYPTVADETPEGSYTLRMYRTEYGPVTHRGVVDGDPVAFASLRSSYFHEVDSLIGFQKFNDPGAIESAEDFQQAASDVNFTFNWFYSDADDAAYVNSGDNPVRHSDVDPSMPVTANAGFDWQGWDPDNNTADYTPFEQHPQSINQDYYVSWNNAQAEDYAAGGYEKGSVHRGDLLDNRVEELISDGGEITRADLTAAMAEAGLADLRAEEVLPSLLEVIDSADVDDSDVDDAVQELREWQDAGGLRQETEPGSQTYDHAEAIATMDAWWPLLVQEQFEPRLGTDAYQAMTSVLPVDESPHQTSHEGSAYQAGWWGYVDKDLRSVLGHDVRGPLRDQFCGDGDLDQCGEILVDTLSTAMDQPQDEVYPGDGSCEAGDQWCADAIVHNSLGGIDQDMISWQNRPTYQLVMEFPERREE